MHEFVNIGITLKSREKLRKLAKRTNMKMSHIVDCALDDYTKKILPSPTKDDR